VAWAQVCLQSGAFVVGLGAAARRWLDSDLVGIAATLYTFAVPVLAFVIFRVGGGVVGVVGDATVAMHGDADRQGDQLLRLRVERAVRCGGLVQLTEFSRGIIAG
jgi:hypothetical protein